MSNQQGRVILIDRKVRRTSPAGRRFVQHLNVPPRRYPQAVHLPFDMPIRVYYIVQASNIRTSTADPALRDTDGCFVNQLGSCDISFLPTCSSVLATGSNRTEWMYTSCVPRRMRRFPSSRADETAMLMMV